MTAGSTTTPAGHEAWGLELVVPEDQVVRAWRVLSAQPLTLEGRCPSCGHENLVQLPDRVVGGLAAQTGDEPPISVQVRAVPCACLRNHANRPKDVPYGCGRYWLARITKKVDGSYDLAVEHDISLAPMAKALDDAVRSQGKRVRDLATKWVSGLTAILGLLSVSGIATGTDALTGIGTRGRVALLIALVATVAAAGAALLFTYRAAYGWPKLTDVGDVDKERAWYEEEQAYGPTAEARLRVGIGSAFVALGLALVVTGLLWFLPREGLPDTSCQVTGHGSCQLP